MEKCGVLLPVFSLPSKSGIGTLGKSAFEFIDFLAQAGQDFWQVLPLNPTSYGDSPYQSPSAFAGNPNFIDLQLLAEKGYLSEADVAEAERENTGRVDYAKCGAIVEKILRKAHEKFAAHPPSDYAEFVSSQSYWLEDYAVFMALKDSFGGVSWENWRDEFRKKNSVEVCDFKERHASETAFYRFVQYEFHMQWQAVRRYANERGIKIIGDMPIYVAYDSADVWAHPQLFLLNKGLKCTLVAGVPPDAFTSDGQLWGNPIYDWEYMKKDGYGWWAKRIEKAAELYDFVRIDHFRGFESFYTVKADAGNAKTGEWKKGPGIKLFDTLKESVGDMNVIAEDLGFLDEHVREMVRQTGYPSMKVLQFGLDGNPDSEYLPKNYPHNCIAYTGTHDNDTSRGFYDALSAGQRRAARKVLKCPPFKNFVKHMIECLFKSDAKYVVIPVQDLLGEGSDCRINVPSTLGGINWQYRLKEIPYGKSDYLKKITRKYRRA